MKIALVHDYLGEFGGAERVLLALSSMYPDAPIYTAFWRPGPAWDRFKTKDVRVSWAQAIPGFASRLHSPLRFLAPFIWRSFDLSEYDVVISSASWYITKGFGNRGSPSTGSGRSKTIEICYCHTPPRWLYGFPTSIEWQRYRVIRWYAALVGFFMRQYDYWAAQRVNYFIANSNNTAKRIDKFYRRSSEVIYPPVDIPVRPRVKKEDYFFIISRIVGGKGLALAVEAATTLGLRLKIAGVPAGYSREYKDLRTKSGRTVEFLGEVTDKELAKLYAGATAFLALATDEDFGMTPVESMAMGTPVIAFRGGGYVESVIEGKTGIFFDAPTPASLIKAIKKFQSMHFLPQDCVAQAQKFSTSRFKKRMAEFVDTHSRKAP